MFKEIKSALKGTHLSFKKQNTTQKGNHAEMLAKAYLQKQGLKFVASQFHSKMGEIDLIMRQAQEVIFVEVRFLRHAAYYEPSDTVNFVKQRKLLLTAQYYLNTHAWTEDFTARFDVISIVGDQLNPKITWIPNAFGVE